MYKCVVILVFCEDIHSTVLNSFLKNHCGHGEDEPDRPCLCVCPALPWAHCPAPLTLALTLPLALAGRCGAVCLVRGGSVAVQRVGQRAASAGACSNLPDHLSSTFPAPGTNHVELRMSLFNFSKSSPECFELQFLPIYLLLMFSCFQGVLVSNLRRILLLIWQNRCGFLFLKKKNAFPYSFYGFRIGERSHSLMSLLP